MINAKICLLGLLAMPACGCGILSEALDGVGRRRATPKEVTASTGPLLDAYANRTRTRVSIKYALRSGRDRWINIRSFDVHKQLRRNRRGLRAGSNQRQEYLWISRDIVRRCSSERPRWKISKMEPLQVTPLSGLGLPVDREELGVALDINRSRIESYTLAEVKLLMSFEGNDQPRTIVFRVEENWYRTPLGNAAQVLQPVTYAIDVLTCPIQFFIIMWNFGR